MSSHALAASCSAYTVATSGRIVPSSSSRAILPSTSLDGESLIITPDTRCIAASSWETGWVAETRWPPSFKTRNDRFCVSPPTRSKTTSTLSRRTLLELRLSIVDDPAGSDGLEIRLIVAACRGNDGGACMRCQLNRIGAHSAGTTMDQDRLSLFQVTMGEDSLPRRLGQIGRASCRERVLVTV